MKDFPSLKEHNLSYKKLFLKCGGNNPHVSDAIAFAAEHDDICRVMRSLFPVKKLQESGSFFTGRILAEKLISAFSLPIDRNSRVLDPACGAGNLLIECSRHLPVYPSLYRTLTEWGGILHGWDINPSYIESTKLRLILEAVRRGCQSDCTLEDACQRLRRIHCFDALSAQAENFTGITHLAANPPFIATPSPCPNTWGEGKTNLAGVMLLHCLQYLPDGAEVSVILPDVLRSGSRYRIFRQKTETYLDAQCDQLGRFDEKTNVDVFLLHGKRCNKSKIFWYEESDGQTVGDKFEVFTGPVVEYREVFKGPETPYLTAKNVKTGEIIEQAGHLRPYSGKTHCGPLVLLKRTSSPKEKIRLKVAVVADTRPLALENHLIAIRPHSGTLDDCLMLADWLCKTTANEFINKRIRMRHLSVGAGKSIPLPINIPES